MEDQFDVEPVAVCPICGSRVLDVGQRYYVCEKSQSDSNPCKFRVGKSIYGQPIEVEQVKKLIETGRTDLLTHFVSKAGRFFSAYLVMDDQNKVTFKFPGDRNSDSEFRHELNGLPRPPKNSSPHPRPPLGFEAAHAEWIKQGAPAGQYRIPSYYESVYWELVREAILERDLHKCVRCDGIATQAHHLNYDYVGTEHLHPESLISVCRSCHGLVEHAGHAESLISRIERRICALDRGQELPRAYSRLIDYQVELVKLRELFSARIPYTNERESTEVPPLDRNRDYLRKDAQKINVATSELQSWPGTDDEKRARIRGLLRKEIENVRDFVTEVLRPNRTGNPF